MVLFVRSFVKSVEVREVFSIRNQTLNIFFVPFGLIPLVASRVTLLLLSGGRFVFLDTEIVQILLLLTLRISIRMGVRLTFHIGAFQDLVHRSETRAILSVEVKTSTVNTATTEYCRIMVYRGVWLTNLTIRIAVKLTTDPGDLIVHQEAVHDTPLVSLLIKHPKWCGIKSSEP